MAGERLLVPLSESVTVRQTVAHAVRSEFVDDADGDEIGSSVDSDAETSVDGADQVDATDATTVDGTDVTPAEGTDVTPADDRAGGEGIPELHLVVALPYEAELADGERDVEEARELLDRAVAWANEDADDRPLTIETAILGTDEYLFGSRDYAATFAEYATDRGIDRVILDPEYQPLSSSASLQPLERELDREGLAWAEAPVDRPARHERLVGRASFDRYVALFGVAYGFYLVLGDPTYSFDLVTGAAVAGIVSITLAHVTFAAAPHRVRSPIRNLRFVAYIPYLLYEIVKANLAVSVVILRPSMPIDPRMTRVRARVPSGLPLFALANSITLTPGTLTVRANDQRLVVHTLVEGAKEDLFGGALERAVRFVFYGRAAARIPSPRERGDAEEIGGEEL